MTTDTGVVVGEECQLVHDRWMGVAWVRIEQISADYFGVRVISGSLRNRRVTSGVLSRGMRMHLSKAGCTFLGVRRDWRAA